MNSAPERKLYVVLNPIANRGSAKIAWEKIAPGLRERGWLPEIIQSENRDHILNSVREVVTGGAKYLAAAGGDGTLQNVLDGLMAAPPGPLSENICLGAFGIGTSNDFHKPLSPDRMINGFPVRFSLDNAQKYDIMKLEAKLPDGKTETRHFIQSAHLGTIPATNFLLTRGNSFFSALFRVWYKPALLLASAWTVFTYRGFSGEVKMAGTSHRGSFSGLSIVKRPHIAGSFVFKTSRLPNDRLLDIALCGKIGSLQLIGLIDKFEKEGLKGHPEVTYFEGNSLDATFDQPQPIDYDGELIVARSVRISIDPRTITIMG